MITIYKNAKLDSPKVYEELNDIRKTLADNQFMALLKDDAKRAARVLGTAKTSFEPIYWRRNDNDSVYLDFIVTVN